MPSGEPQTRAQTRSVFVLFEIQQAQSRTHPQNLSASLHRAVCSLFKWLVLAVVRQDLFSSFFRSVPLFFFHTWGKAEFHIFIPEGRLKIVHLALKRREEREALRALEENCLSLGPRSPPFSSTTPITSLRDAAQPHSSLPAAAAAPRLAGPQQCPLRSSDEVQDHPEDAVQASQQHFCYQCL